VGRVAIGQGGAEGQDLATPLQMAEVAATVANGGKLMQPQLVQQVTDPDGRVTEKLTPHVQSTAISPQTASELTTMMTHVTQDPEGTAAGLTVSGGVAFAGKTGTAEIGDPANGINQPWFIAFAPAQNPQVAVAATIERCQGCFGAQVAGPVATQVIDSLLNGG
jgi:peptidoglycan glycosyltransferase